MVPLREVGASSATFTGRLITAGNASAALAALLLPSPYAAVDVVYSDAAPEGLAVAHFRPCSPGAASIGPALSMAGAAAGAAALLTVTVTDADLNLDPTVRERASAAVASGVDRAGVVLLEAGWDSAVFTAAVAAG